jgi:hypothetical protein
MFIVTNVVFLDSFASEQECDSGVKSNAPVKFRMRAPIKMGTQLRDEFERQPDA